MRLIAILIVGALTLAACGGGDDSSAASTPAAGATGVTGGGATGDAGGAGIFGSAECASAVAAWSSAAAAAGLAAAGTPDDLEQSLDQLQAFAETAPEEIRDDLTLVYQAYAEFITALQDAGYDPASGQVPTPDQIAAIEAASQSLDDADVQAASENVSAWFDANCSS